MSDTQAIWKRLIKEGMTEPGAAGMMGNMQAESGLKSNNVEDTLQKILGTTDERYTADVDSGRISRAKFLNPKPGKQWGYGLCQWTSPSRKAGLYDLCKSRGVSISDLDTQLDWLIHELKTAYTPVWKVLTTATSVQAASDAVLIKFEIPANAAGMKAYRGQLGMAIYNQMKGGSSVSKVTAENILDIARSYIGCKESDGSHKKIIDLYNSHKPLSRGYAVRYTDSWCDTFVSAVFIKAGATDLIGGTECGVEEHVKKFKAKGIWQEDGTIIPKPGYIIVYNWDKTSQPNDGYADHIGFVEKVSGKMITAIEGNYKDSVGRRTNIPVGWGPIRGYAIPKYATSSGKTEEKQEQTATQQQAGGGTTLSKAKKWNGIVVDKTGANVRTWPGTENHQVSFSPLKYGTVVDVCDTIKATDQTDWYYIRYNGRYGFVSAALIQRKETAAAAPFTPKEQATKKTATYGASIGPDKSVAGTYKVTTDSLNIRNRAGVDTAKGCTILGAIPEGAKVQNYGFYSMVGGVKWLYIQVTYDGVTYTGHCSGEYLKKV